jgi:chitin synthase
MATPTTTTNKFDLSQQQEKTDDAITTTLKTAFLNNVLYSRISDSTLVAMNPYKNMPLQQQTPHYVAEYKDTGSDALEPLPTHIYKLTNQAYLHMRRTGIDQSLILW